MSEEKSEFVIEVVKLPEPAKHPNADKLEIFHVNGYPCCSGIGQFKAGDLAVYLPVDAVVDTSRPEFAFLHKEGSGRHRIRAVRLRGSFSMGLLVPAPASLRVGESAEEALGVTKYVNPNEVAQARRDGNVAARSSGVSATFFPIYGLDALRKYGNVLKDGEPVVLTEKIHGCNFRCGYKNGKFWVGSHKVMRGSTRHWLKEWAERTWLKVKTLFGVKHRAGLIARAGDVWWECAQQYGLQEIMSRPENQDFVLYGEIYGEGVQDLTYDSPKGRKFLVFDVLNRKTREYLNFGDMSVWCQSNGLFRVPHITSAPWSQALVSLYANGTSLLNPKQIREGFVVRPKLERMDPLIGRVSLKMIGEDYLLRKE